MRAFIFLFVSICLQLASATPTRNAQHVFRAPSVEIVKAETAQRKLKGRFLHITDLHADPFYKIHSSTAEGVACHRGSGPAGTYGAETSDCDSPFALINETFRWIEDNLRDKIDFVVWTGDSARHDSDEKRPRNAKQVLGLNKFIAGKFVEVFGNGKDGGDPNYEMVIPIVPTFGNNDILPHNILLAGPNKWLKQYADIWHKFIPEEQRHGFQRGGWFWVETIPNKLAIFSLNTLYFFDHNAAVDGCALKSEPGWEHMEWLRIQLQFVRDRGMKAILIGHVPPARTDSKQLWDETCWQKYTLWLKQYRDVVISSLFGHMNIDHFLLQDTKEIDLGVLGGIEAASVSRDHLDDELSIQSAADYLEELREGWSKLPNPPSAFSEGEIDGDAGETKKGKKGKKPKKNKDLEKIGGPWGERYHLSSIAPSVVPNFFPTLRVIEYNITGLEKSSVWTPSSSTDEISMAHWYEDIFSPEENIEEPAEDDESSKKKKKHKKKKPKKPDFIVPSPPSKSSPPGPAYSPQTLTLLGYTQYFANLTYINNDLKRSIASGGVMAGEEDLGQEKDIEDASWHEGRHHKKKPKDPKPHPREFAYEVEYSTFNDSLFALDDLTVLSYLKLAHRIGEYKPIKGGEVDFDFNEEPSDTSTSKILSLPDSLDIKQCEARSFLARLFGSYVDVVKEWLFLAMGKEADVGMEDEGSEALGHKKGHKKKKGHRKRNRNRAWLTFIARAFVGTLDEEEVKDF